MKRRINNSQCDDVVILAMTCSQFQNKRLARFEDFHRQCNLIHNDPNRAKKRNFHEFQQENRQQTDNALLVSNDNCEHQDFSWLSDGTFAANSTRLLATRLACQRRAPPNHFLPVITQRVLCYLEDLFYGDESENGVAVPSNLGLFLNFLQERSLNQTQLEIDAELVLQYLLSIELLVESSEGVSLINDVAAAHTAHANRLFDCALSSRSTHPLEINNSTNDEEFLSIVGDLIDNITHDATWRRTNRSRAECVEHLLPFCVRTVTVPPLDIVERLVRHGIVQFDENTGMLNVSLPTTDD